MAELFRYAAFISYSSKDAGFAKRLHGALESYRIPRSLGEFDLIGGGKKNRIYPVFRDREELSAGDLGERVEAALKASAALIVVCSPNSAASPSVQKEIGYFAGLGRRNRIFAIIADNAPLTDEAGADATPLCFPPAFRGDALQGTDALEPLAADARKGKDGFRNAWLKLVAGIADVNAGALADRDRQRQRLQRVQAACAGAAAIAAAGLAFAFIEERAARIDMSVQAAVLTSQGHSTQAIPLALAGLPSRGDVLAITNDHGEAALMRSGAGARIMADLGALRGGDSVALSADGGFVATIAPNHEGTLRDLRSGAQRPLGPLTQLAPLTFAPDGAHLLAIARGRRGYLYNLRAGTKTTACSRCISR